MSDNTAPEKRIYGTIIFIITILIAAGLTLSQQSTDESTPSQATDSKENELPSHYANSTTGERFNYSTNVSDVTDSLIRHDLVTVNQSG